MKQLLSISILLLANICLFAQQPTYKNYTTDEGLPSNQIYDIIEDDNGLLWIATDKGLVTFNGETFITYTTKNGLPDNSVLSLYKGNSGRIYLASFSGGVCYYYRDSFYRHLLNPEIKKLTRNQFIVSLAEDKDTNIYFTVNGIDTIFRLTTDNKLLKYHPNSFNNNLNQRYFFKNINNSWIYSNNAAKYDLAPEKIINISIQPSTKTIHFNGLKDMLIIKKTITSTRKNEYLFAYKKFQEEKPKGYLTIIKDRLNDTTIIYDNEIQCVYYDTVNNYFFIGFKNNGVYRYNSIKDLGTKNYYPILPGKTISTIHKDRYGNYWFTSNTSGLYKMPSFTFVDYSKVIQPNFKVTANNKHIYWLSSDGTVNTLEGNTPKNLSLTRQYSNVSFFSVSDEILFIKQGINLNVVNTNTGRQSIFEYNGGISSIKTISPSKFTIGGLLGFSIIENNQITYSSETSKHLYERITAIETVDSSQLLVGTISGLYHYKNERINPVTVINTLVPERISRIKKLNDSEYVVANNSNFLSILNFKTMQVVDLRTYSNELTISDICVNNDSSFWVASNKGIVLFTITKSAVNTSIIDQRDGLLSNNVLSINKIGDKLWVTTNKGTMYIVLDKLKKSPPPKVYLNYIKLGDEDIKYKSKIFEWDNYTLSINLSTTSKSSENEMTYAYYLDGFDADTSYTSNSNIRYTSLPSGNYKILVWAIDKNGIQSSNIIMRDFTINKHYTETWWFISLMVLAGILVVSSIFLLVIRNLNRRSTLQKNLLLSEQKALRAQMNPHFTFNALNSIQYFLTDNDKRSATTFLSKFSMLVRKVLYNSNNNLITLEEEITTLKLYLDLEKLRFGDKLDVEVNVDEDIYIEEIQVPSMIIQPFLENAIWHGIMPKESGEGKLSLNFTMQNEQLVCTIKDDGIGREKSAELKAIQRKGHKSTGLKNIEDRISVLNHINPNNKITIKINDLKNTNLEAIGTEVIITFEQDDKLYDKP